MKSVVNINDVLDGHFGLDLVCVDRLYLNAYVPFLEVGGQVNRFCHHLGQPIASPAVIEKIGNRFRREVDVFAAEHDVPILHLKKPDRSRWDDRKLDRVRRYMDEAAQSRMLRRGRHRGGPGVPIRLQRHQEDHELFFYPDHIEFWPGRLGSATTGHSFVALSYRPLLSPRHWSFGPTRSSR